MDLMDFIDIMDFMDLMDFFGESKSIQNHGVLICKSKSMDYVFDGFQIQEIHNP